jgi:hypothetical protein
MSEHRRRAHCHVTGIELHVEQGHMLDVYAAQRHHAELLEKAAAVQRLLDQLGDVRVRTVAGAAMRQRPLVCAAVVQAYGDLATLFISFPEMRQRWAAAALKQARAHSVYGPAIASLNPEDTARMERLGRGLVDRLSRLSRHRLGDTTARAVRWGAAVALVALDEDAAFAKLLEHAAAKTLSTVGIPEECVDVLQQVCDQISGKAPSAPVAAPPGEAKS